MDWKERLTKEKSLFQVYRKARKLASSRWNARVAWLIFLVLTISLGVNAYYGQPFVPYAALISGIREIAEIGFSFTTAILGFLIAGFAIFASITKPDVFILLAKLDHHKGGISRLQFMFFNFLLIFIHCIAFLSVTIFVKMMFYKNGPLTQGVNFLLSIEPFLAIYIVSFSFIILTAWLFFLLMLLKSFVWNFYQAVLVTIGIEAEMIERRAKHKTAKRAKRKAEQS